VHFLLVAPDPRNHSIIDVKHKDTGVLCYRKIRHMVPHIYALSLIEPGESKKKSVPVLGVSAFQVPKKKKSKFLPVATPLDTFTVVTEIQSLSSSSKEKVIVLQEPEQTVRVRQNGRLGFEWAFEWEGQKLRW